jgi:hypothetical protein
METEYSKTLQERSAHALEKRSWGTYGMVLGAGLVLVGGLELKTVGIIMIIVGAVWFYTQNQIINDCHRR